MVSVPRWGGKQLCMGSTWWAGGCTSRWACRARSTSTTSLLFSSRRLEGSRDAESHAGTILGDAHTHHHSQQHSQDPQPQQNPPPTHTSACPGSATGCAGYPYPQLGMQHSPLPGPSPIGCHLARCCLMGWGHLRAFQLHKHPLVLSAGGEPWHNGSPRGGGRTGSTHWSRSLSWNALLRCSSRPRDISGAESGSCAARGGSGGAGRGAAIAGRPRWRRHTVLLPGAARGSRSGFLPTALSVTREARSTHRVVCGSGTEPMGNPGCSMACHSQKP